MKTKGCPVFLLKVEKVVRKMAWQEFPEVRRHDPEKGGARAVGGSEDKPRVTPWKRSFCDPIFV